MSKSYFLLTIITLIHPFSLAADKVSKCKLLTQNIYSSDKNFPINEIRNPRSIVLWTASKCEKPPIGEGKVVQLCDAELTSGGAIIYWKKSTRMQKIVPGYIVCK